MIDPKSSSQASTMNATDPHSLHAHKKGDAKHAHSKQVSNQNLLLIALVLTLGFSGVEGTAAYFANSLALISDAGHMVTDAAALGLALLAQIISRRPPSAKHSFGFGRAEALAAFVNSIVMLALVAWIVFEAISRFYDPHKVDGLTVTVVAAIGLLMNIVVAWVLSRDKKSVNTRAALVHVMGDLLGSVAALIAGVVIQFTGWMPIDAILSILVSLLILKSTISILRESYHFLMEGVPLHIDYLAVGNDLIAAAAGVVRGTWRLSPFFVLSKNTVLFFNTTCSNVSVYISRIRMADSTASVNMHRNAGRCSSCSGRCLRGSTPAAIMSSTCSNSPSSSRRSRSTSTLVQPASFPSSSVYCEYPSGSVLKGRSGSSKIFWRNPQSVQRAMAPILDRMVDGASFSSRFIFRIHSSTQSTVMPARCWLSMNLA